MFPEFCSERLHILLASKQVSVTLHQPAIDTEHLQRFSEKRTNPDKALTIPDFAPNIHPCTEDREEKLTINDLLEAESIVTISDPDFRPKMDPIVAAIMGIRSIPLENNVLDLV